MSKLLDGLNPSQREAVMHETGPLLIIAGPGSGKTRTVVHSIAYAIENGVMPEQILAFSFTVKAREELRNRVKEIVEEEKGHHINISTFHSFCRQVLREDIDELGNGYARNFKALEENDQRRIVKDLMHINEQQVRAEIEHIQSYKFPNPGEILDFIKKCKAREISPLNAAPYAPELHMSEVYVEIYKRYEQRLQSEGWIDYESQQLFTDELFSKVPEVKTKWQNRFKLIFVDEFQDTDPIQYRIVNTLAKSHQNLRGVGDDDQGIYGWRGADIQNILDFEKDYPNAKVIPLGQNYRSTKRIVEASRALADFNPDRRDKELFTRNFEGEKVKHLHCENNEEEAATIAALIQRSVDRGDWQPNDFAVLYRTNNQANVLKTALSNLGIQYQVDHSSLDAPATSVTIMTIHKSKGLEFPNVFVSGICKDLLPFYYSRDEKDWPEELRLLYVAMTRAKNWLCLSSYETEVGSRHERGQSPFLNRNYIPSNLLESVETLENSCIPPSPLDMTVPEIDGETLGYVEPLPEKLLGDGMTVLGIDPGIQNVGWSITQKLSDGYTVLDYGTETTRNWQNTLFQTRNKINQLITLHRPDAIAVEKLEGATEDWFRYVAGCVATVRSIADKEGIECRLYTPQHVKYAATDNRKASKEDVQKAVKRMCNLQQIPEPHHSADAIATSLCYLRSYLNSSRFEGNRRKQERYEASCDYLGKGQYEAAVDGFKETINIDPIYTEAHSGLGRAYLAQGNLEAAENAAQKAQKLAENNHPDSQKLLEAIGHYRFGCNSLNNSEWNIAIDKFKEAINREPIFTEAHCGLSKAYLETDNLEAAKNAAEEALRLRNDYPPAREFLNKVKMKSYYKGKTYFNREEYNQAILELQRAVKIDQDFKGAYHYLGKTYFKLEYLEAAEKEAREALRVDSTYERASELLGEIKQKHKEQGDEHRNRKAYSEAVKSYQQAINIDDKYKNAYNSLGIAYWKMKEYSKAISAYQQAINIDERCQVVHTNLSIVYLEISEYTKAVSSLKRAIAIKPDYHNAYFNLARTYFKMENLHDASEAILMAFKLDANEQNTLKLLKDIQNAHLLQGHDYFSRGNIAVAESSAKKALRLDSSYQPAIDFLEKIKQEYYTQARANIENNDHIAAINFLKKTLEIDSDFIEAHYSLGETYFKRGELELAVKEAREVSRIDPNYELASRLLISIKEEYYKRGLAEVEHCKWKPVEKLAEEALRIDPNYELASGLLRQAYYEQGLAHIKNSRYEKGINILQKANDIDTNCEKTHYYLGWTYFKLNRLKEAQLAIKNALSIQPNYPQASELLSEIYHPRNWLKLGGAKVRRLARWIVNRIGF